ncbi:MAG TPA: polysaccharide deacetylase family protein [Longimicrobium sp.]|jgi:peptidoglycan/xylan/chitin deacetylase (PgdA/CDA1 family)
MLLRSARTLLLAVLLATGCATAPAPSAPRPSTGIPVLTWHNLKDHLTEGDGSMTESYASFEAMLRFLRENGFRSVFPEAAGTPGGRPVILTFDDGHRESALGAAALLERYGFRGIFFVIPNRTRAEPGNFLSPDDLVRLSRAGHRIAPHGYDHRSMATSVTEVAATLARSAGMTGESARTAPSVLDFAFPFGHYLPEVAEAVGQRFRYLHTVNPGYWDGRSALLPRMLIMPAVDPALFRDYVLGGADYRPILEPLFADGAVAETVSFTARGAPVPDSIQIFAISADAEGRSYTIRPLGENLRINGDTVTVALGAHMRRYHGPGREVISYALVTRRDGRLRYLSPGVLNWIRDPGAPR